MRRPKGFGVWAYEAATQELVWSDEMLSMFGLEQGGPSPSVEVAETYLPPEAQRLHRRAAEEAVSQALQEAQATGRITSHTTPQLHLNLGTASKPRHVEATCAAIAGPEGLIRSWGVFTDVTGQRLAEQVLARSEHRLRAVCDSMQDGLLISCEGVVIDCNLPCSDLFRVPRDEVVGRALSDFDADGPRLSEAIASAGLAPRPLHVRPVGASPVEVELHTHEVPDGDRSVSVSTLVDLTSRRAAESERNRLLAAIEHSSEAIVLCDRTSRISYANQAAEAMGGVPRERLIGQTMDVPHQGSDAVEAIIKALAVGQPWRGRFRRTLPDGELLSSEIRLAPVEGSSDDFVLTAIDTSREEELAHQLAHTRRLDALGTLAGGITHDFNNILNGVLGFVEVARAGLSASHPSAQALDQSLSGIGRARRLIEQILTFSRQVPPQLHPVEVRPLVNDAVAFLSAGFPAGVELSTSIAPNAGHVLGDEAQLHQVLANLCTNAAQAPGTRRVRIEARRLLVKREGAEQSFVRLSVDDDGAGIPVDLHGRIFDPFFTTKGSRGSGMGLAVVHGIVESHGGWTELVSQPGRGSRFDIYLPGARAGSNDRVQARPAVDLSPLASRRVLLVDDDPDGLEVGRRHLCGAGAEVLAFRDPVEALAVFASEPRTFDILVTDLGMPELGGEELARRVRAFRPELPVILVSGQMGKAQMPDPNARFVAKPFTRRELLVAVASSLSAPT